MIEPQAKLPTGRAERLAGHSLIARKPDFGRSSAGRNPSGETVTSRPAARARRVWAASPVAARLRTIDPRRLGACVTGSLRRGRRRAGRYFGGRPSPSWRRRHSARALLAGRRRARGAAAPRPRRGRWSRSRHGAATVVPPTVVGSACRFRALPEAVADGPPARVLNHRPEPCAWCLPPRANDRCVSISRSSRKPDL